MYAMFVVVRLYVIVFDFASELLLAVVNSDEEVSMSFLLCCMFVLSRRSISNFPTQEQRVISPSYTLFCCCLSVLSRIVRAHCKLIFVEVRRVVYFLLAVFVAARFRQKNVVLRAYVFIRALGRELTRFFCDVRQAFGQGSGLVGNEQQKRIWILFKRLSRKENFQKSSFLQARKVTKMIDMIRDRPCFIPSLKRRRSPLLLGFQHHQQSPLNSADLASFLSFLAIFLVYPTSTSANECICVCSTSSLPSSFPASAREDKADACRGTRSLNSPSSWAPEFCLVVDAVVLLRRRRVCLLRRSSSLSSWR